MHAFMFSELQWAPWHDCSMGAVVICNLVVANSSLLESGPVHKKEIVPGTGNLANHLGLVRSGILEENL